MPLEGVWRKERWGEVIYLVLPLLGDLGVRHGFSTRLGGVSRGAFSSLNLAFDVGDVPEKVAKNRYLFCQALGIEEEKLYLLRQVHGARVVVAEETPPGVEADGVLSGQKGLALGVLVADCLPVLLAAPRVGVAGAVHAGWRGTQQGVVQAAVRLMQQRWGVRPQEIYAGFGPGIGPECYLVGTEVVAELRRNLPFWEQFTCQVKGGWQVDLLLANYLQLLACGVPEDNIAAVGLCTACRQELFFSFRGSGGKTGRMLGVIQA